MKKYRLIDNIEAWGTEAKYGDIITEDELIRLADEWDKDIDTLMEDLEEIEDPDEYTVFWIGGEKDGETIATFETERAAVNFAKAYQDEHEADFDPCWGGVGIANKDRDYIEW